MAQPFLLYHWSPASRRKQILKEGLCPGKLSRCGQWKPPFVCFCKSPSAAWGLSAMMENENCWWDLWMTYSNTLNGYETLALGQDHTPTEYRVYHRIKKGDIWYVGSREYTKRKNHN